MGEVEVQTPPPLVREIKELLKGPTPTPEQLAAFDADTRPSVQRLVAGWKERQRLRALQPPDAVELAVAKAVEAYGAEHPVDEPAGGLDACTTLGGKLFASLGPEQGGKMLLEILGRCHQPVTPPDRPKILTLNAEGQRKFCAEVSSRLGIRPAPTPPPASQGVSADAPY